MTRSLVIAFVLALGIKLLAQVPSTDLPTSIPNLDQLPTSPRWHWVEDREIDRIRDISKHKSISRNDATALVNAFISLDSGFYSTTGIDGSHRSKEGWSFWLMGCLGPANQSGPPYAVVNASTGRLTIPSKKISLLPRELVSFILEHRTRRPNPIHPTPGA